jgi:hypothetical protein
MMLFAFIIALIVLYNGYFVSARSRDSFFQRVVIDTHNKYRYKHDVSPLTWDWELANHAQRWSNRCEYEHSDVSVYVVVCDIRQI